MSTVDRIMRAYASKHDLSPSQAVFVRDEISKFIDELMTEPRRAPAILPQSASGPDPRAE